MRYMKSGMISRLLFCLKHFFLFVKRNRTAILAVITLCCALLLVISRNPSHNIDREVKKIERNVKKRLDMLSGYVEEIKNNSLSDSWPELKDFPEDMIIYKYNSDTIQYWKNQFPIGNDEVDILPLWYRLSYLNTKNYFNTPLAYLDNNVLQYVNLGTGWYLVDVQIVGRAKIVSALLVKTEYMGSGSSLISRNNPYITKNKRIKIVPVSSDEGVVVSGADGSPLFSVLEEKFSASVSYNYALGWITVLLAFVTMYSFLYNHHKFRYYVMYLVGLAILRLICMGFDSYLWDYDIFSPMLYADSGLFSSFGGLLLNNMFVFLAMLGLFQLRRSIVGKLNILRRRIVADAGIGDIWRRSLAVALIFAIPIAIAIYIHFTLKSLIYNSNIVLELYRLDELTLYSCLAYISYGLLFIALLLSMQLAVASVRRFRGFSLLGYRSTVVFILVVSLYTLVTVSVCGLSRERERVKMWVGKLSVERDVGLELQLRSIEGKILTDKVIASILVSPEGGLNVLKNRLEELYLKGMTQRYEIKLNICRPNDVLLYNQGQYMVDCNNFFNEIKQYGTPLTDNSNFFFLNNYNGKISYLGVFYYLTPIGIVNLYLELDSRHSKNMQGYPSQLLNYKQVDNTNLPFSYSCGKYIDGRLITYNGDYNFPTSVDEMKYDVGFSSYKKGKNLFFVDKSITGKIIVITRPTRGILSYFISFSYLVLFYGGLLFLFLRIRRMNKNVISIRMPKKSFKRKITYLVTASLVFALICMGAGSIWFSVIFYNENNRLQMEEKLQTVQSTLEEYCKYFEAYTQLNTQDLISSIDRLSSGIRADINLYDPHGRLMRSTQPELFDKSLISSRINSDAYDKLVHERKRQVQNVEKLGDLEYYSLYSPILNNNGNLVAIANIPYFVKPSDFRGDLSAVIATIINIYLLLLIAAIVGGGMLSKQLSKPLAAISSKMKRMDVSKKAEHIDYRNKDELGLLVAAYNKMVDDLEESTRQLAKKEREHAWSEMARQIAHEIKNPLTPMRLSIQHLISMKQRNISGWENKFEDVANSILEQIEILSNTASEFSSFAKFYFEESTEINLYSLLNEQKILFDTHDNIRISFVHEMDDAVVFARKGQIIRVIVNLLSNAIQAVEANGGGYVKISLIQDYGGYRVSFEDNGPGVKEEDVGKLFKPNFTTKSSGTGLGLAISQNIIEQSGGKISYSRSEFGGANFSFFLPLAALRMKDEHRDE